MKTSILSTNINQKLDEMEESIIELIDIAEKTVNGGLDDVLEFNEKYLIITKQIDSVSNDLMTLDKSHTNPLWDRFDSLNDDLNYVYDTSSIPINSVLVKNTMVLQEQYQKHEGLQLAVFSIVLTIISFVLTNAKILAVDQIDFKNVLLVNLSFILAADILFSFICYFIGIQYNNKKRWFRLYSFIIIPVFLIVAIICVALFVN